MVKNKYNNNLIYIENTAEFSDLQILVLNKSAQLNENVSIVRLPEENVRCPRKMTMKVSGWGRSWVKDGAETELSRFLMTTEVTCLDPHGYCKVFGYQRYENSTICAGNLKHSNTGTGSGDSGGSYVNLIVIVIRV